MSTSPQRPAPPLADAELLEKYGLTDPLTDAQRFAQQVHLLGVQRRAFLGCTITYRPGELVIPTYAITGTDSQGQAVNTSSDSARQSLAEMIRILNRRYAAQQGGTDRRTQVRALLDANHPK